MESGRRPWLRSSNMSGSDPVAGAAGREVLDWRAPGLAGAVWLGAELGIRGDGGLIVIAVLAGVLMVLLGWRSRRWLPVGLALGVVVSIGLSAARVAAVSSEQSQGWVQSGAVAEITVRLGAGTSRQGGFGQTTWMASGTLLRLSIRGEQWKSGAPVRISVTGPNLASWAGIPAGSVVSATAKLSPAETGDPITAWVRASGAPLVVEPPGVIDAAVNQVWAGLRQAAAPLPDGPRRLVPALVVGDTTDLPTDFAEQFRATGLTHLMAVSGSNLTILLATLIWFAGRVGVGGWARRVLAGIAVVGFVILCRGEPSVLRAAAMGVVGLAALGWGGGRQGMRYLATAVIGLLVIEPWLARSVGFALSVSASAGIILWARSWAHRLVSWMPLWLAEAISVPLAAQIATQPIVSAISGQLSAVAVLANLAAAPMVGPATILGFGAASMSVFAPVVSIGLAWAAGGFAQVICWIAETGASLPGAVVQWPQDALGTTLLVVICSALAIVLPQVLTKVWLAVGLGIVSVAWLLWPPRPPGWPPEQWDLVSCDVGQGDATVINAGAGRAILVDAGPDPEMVDRCLSQLGITEVALLVLTHLHSDHVAGLPGALRGRTVQALLYSGVQQPAGNWSLVTATIGAPAVTVAEPGLMLGVGPARVEVLSVKPLPAQYETTEDSAAENDASLVLRVVVGEMRVLLAGDVEQAGQQLALRTVRDLTATVFLVPHHGSGHHDPDFLAANEARVTLISVGANNGYGHPAASTLKVLDSLKRPVLRTDQAGAIAVAQRQGQLQVTTIRDPSPK